jgi:hypothetical protein
MAVYVDPDIHTWKGKKWCHLTADSEMELHQFAKMLGLKRSWFQNNSVLPHYDIVDRVRDKAISLGALPITIQEAGLKVRAARKTKSRQS